MPLTLQHLKNLDDLTSLKYYISTQEKDEFRENGLSPVLYIQSDCETPSNRDSYVRELMKFIKVDSYGQCLNNIKFPQELRRNDHLEDLYESNLMKLVAKYKFTLSFENAICDDYVTEKIWRPLMVGSVPVYLGSNNIRDWLPDGENSAVLVDNFKSPHDLAEYLMILDQNSRKYERHLQHKLSDTYPITNDKLKRAINTGWAGETDSLVRKLECKVCEAIISGAKKVNVERTSEADIADTRKYLYSCPRPVSPITRKTNGSNWWTQHWDEAPCHFKLVKDILDKKINLTEKEYNENVFKLYKDKLC